MKVVLSPVGRGEQSSAAPRPCSSSFEDGPVSSKLSFFDSEDFDCFDVFGADSIWLIPEAPKTADASTWPIHAYTVM